jgi:hypothetical protein
VSQGRLEHTSKHTQHTSNIPGAPAPSPCMLLCAACPAQWHCAPLHAATLFCPFAEHCCACVFLACTLHGSPPDLSLTLPLLFACMAPSLPPGNFIINSSRWVLHVTVLVARQHRGNAAQQLCSPLLSLMSISTSYQCLQPHPRGELCTQLSVWMRRCWYRVPRRADTWLCPWPGALLVLSASL